MEYLQACNELNVNVDEPFKLNIKGKHPLYYKIARNHLVVAWREPENRKLKWCNTDITLDELVKYKDKVEKVDEDKLEKDEPIEQIIGISKKDTLARLLGIEIGKEFTFEDEELNPEHLTFMVSMLNGGRLDYGKNSKKAFKRVHTGYYQDLDFVSKIIGKHIEIKEVEEKLDYHQMDVCCHLDSETFKKFENVRKLLGLNKSDMLRNCIKDYLNNDDFGIKKLDKKRIGLEMSPLDFEEEN